MYRNEILSKNSKPSFARSSSCLCKKLIFWWERDGDWQPRLLGGLAPEEVEPQSPHLPGFVPPELCLTSPDHQPVDPLEPHFGPVLVPSFLSEFPPITSLVPPSRPYNLTSSVLKLWTNLNVNFTFNQSASLFQVFLSQYPPIRSRLRMSLLPDVSTGAKPLVQHPPTFLSFSQSLDSIISTAGALVVITSV